MPKILLVDDDDIFRDSLRKNMSEDGHDVHYAPNGKVANSMLLTENFDLVISDIRMPEMDGIELTKTVRTRSQMPIILITGFSDILETQEAYKLGANEFITKPLKRADIQVAIERCLKPKMELSKETSPPPFIEDRFCKLGITDFLSGRAIKFGIYLRLSEYKFVKVAHKGEDLPADRVKYYQGKGVHYLYLKQEDFKKYVGFASVAGQSPVTGVVAQKAELLKFVSEILRENIPHDGVSNNMFESAIAFVEACIDLVTDEVKLTELLLALYQRSKPILVHGMGTSVYSLMIAQLVDWNLPTNKFKLVMGALFRDVGMKDLKCDFLTRPRDTWTSEEKKIFESNVEWATKILDALEVLPNDVREIVKQHIEMTLTQFGGVQIKKAAIRPMTKLILVAEEFCNRIISNKKAPLDAINEMAEVCADQLDKSFFAALVKLFPRTGE